MDTHFYSAQGADKASENNIKSLQHDPATNDLTVIFHRRPLWKYIHHNVPRHVYDSMRNCFSPGRYYHASLKKRYKEFTVLKPEQIEETVKVS